MNLVDMMLEQLKEQAMESGGQSSIRDVSGLSRQTVPNRVMFRLHQAMLFSKAIINTK